MNILGFTPTQIIIGLILYAIHWGVNNMPALAKFKTLQDSLDGVYTKIENEVDGVIVPKVSAVVNGAASDVKLAVADVKKLVTPSPVTLTTTDGK
ncbi:MAG TPA: hypothetical protein VFA81_12140 [Burkholderiales bacterium]|nr:hypothetical protein [Burkholderiales bacterium]